MRNGLDAHVIYRLHLYGMYKLGTRVFFSIVIAIDLIDFKTMLGETQRFGGYSFIPVYVKCQCLFANRRAIRAGTAVNGAT